MCISQPLKRTKNIIFYDFFSQTNCIKTHHRRPKNATAQLKSGYKLARSCSRSCLAGVSLTAFNNLKPMRPVNRQAANRSAYLGALGDLGDVNLLSLAQSSAVLMNRIHQSLHIFRWRKLRNAVAQIKHMAIARAISIDNTLHFL